MAIFNSNSPSRIEIYESLYLICQATQQITEQLERLRSANLLEPAFVEINKMAALQLRAEIATSAVHNLTEPEVKEGHRLEQKRLRMQRKLAEMTPRAGSRRR